MRTRHGDPSSEYAAPMAVCLLVFVILAGAGFLGGYWLMQPKVVPNEGLAAYEPPAGTRLIPLPRKMDAPELAELPKPPLETESAQAGPITEKIETKPIVTKPKVTHKRPKMRPQPGGYPGSAYADSGRWDGAWGAWRGGWNDRW
jgi:hypothetical protein